MILGFIKAGELKAAVLENVRGIQSKQRGASESFIHKLVYILQQQVPEFHWEVVELQAASYMLAQQRGRIFLRGPEDIHCAPSSNATESIWKSHPPGVLR